MENFSGIPKNISMFKEIPFILKLIFYQNIYHFMPFLFMFTQWPAFLGDPRLACGTRLARPSKIMETESARGHTLAACVWGEAD